MYLKLGDKKYQLPDNVIIGRGEPFDIDDRSLARAHAKLILKNGSWKIKDLGTDTGITVNGVRINGGKYKTVGPTDIIMLGKVPLTLYETLQVQECTGVRKISIGESRDYSWLVYGSLFLSSFLVTILNSSGDLVADLIALLIAACSFKVLGTLFVMGRRKFFPFRIIHELLVSTDGVTLYLSDGSNFSLRFGSIKKWHVVGKGFFIKAHGKEFRFLMLDGHMEFERILKNKCLLKVHRGQVLYSWLGVLPGVFALISVILLQMSSAPEMIIPGHFFGFLGVIGLIAYISIEDLRELVPIPWKLSKGTQKVICVTFIALTLNIQYNNFMGKRNPRNLIARLTTCAFQDSEHCHLKGHDRAPASIKSAK